MNGRQNDANHFHAPLGDDHREPNGKHSRNGEFGDLDFALGQAADDCQDQQPLDIVDHGRGQDDFARELVQKPARVQHLGGDAHAGRDHGGAHENRSDRRLARQRHDSPTGHERADHAERGHQRRGSAHAQQLRGLDLEADAEQQEHGAQSGQRVQEGIGGHPVQDAGADHHTGKNFAGEARLPEALEQLGHEFGGSEDHHHEHTRGHPVMTTGRRHHKRSLPA